MPTPLQVGFHILDLVDTIITQRGKGSPSSATWHFLREELAYQAENAVRDSYFMTRRSSTVAIVAILNATERVNDREYLRPPHEGAHVRPEGIPLREAKGIAEG